MNVKRGKTKTYPLKLAEELFNNIHETSEEEGATFLYVVIKWIKVGQYFYNLVKQGKRIKVCSEDGSEEEVIGFII